jgi:hypothetical protein
MKKMSTIRKEAAPIMGKAMDLAKMVALLTVATEGSKAVHSLGKATIGKAISKRQEEKAYQGMLGVTKDMKHSPQARRAFHTLHTFSPAMGKDPLVAGSFVKRTVDFGEMVDPKQIHDIAKTQTYLTGTPRPVDATSALMLAPTATHLLKGASAEQRRIDKARAQRHTTEKLAEIKGKYR